MNDTLKKLASKMYRFWIFAFHYLVVLTNEGEIIKGGSFFIKSKIIVTFAYADGPWIDANGRVIRLSFKNGYLTLGNLRMSIGDD